MSLEKKFYYYIFENTVQCALEIVVKIPACFGCILKLKTVKWQWFQLFLFFIYLQKKNQIQNLKNKINENSRS